MLALDRGKSIRDDLVDRWLDAPNDYAKVVAERRLAEYDRQKHLEQVWKATSKGRGR